MEPAATVSRCALHQLSTTPATHNPPSQAAAPRAHSAIAWLPQEAVCEEVTTEAMPSAPRFQFTVRPPLAHHASVRNCSASSSPLLPPTSALGGWWSLRRVLLARPAPPSTPTVRCARVGSLPHAGR